MHCKSFVLTALVVVGTATGAKANLIVNGGFETGDFSGWTQSGNTGATAVESSGFDGFPSKSGSFFAALGPVGSDGFLSQTFTDVAGQTLTIEFFMASDGGTPNDFGASFDNIPLFPTLINDPAHGYTDFTFTVLATGSDTLQIGGFRNDPSWLALDDVSVNPVAAVPEPGSLVLLGAGLVGMGAIRRSAVKRTA